MRAFLFVVPPELLRRADSWLPNEPVISGYTKSPLHVVRTSCGSLVCCAAMHVRDRCPPLIFVVQLLQQSVMQMSKYHLSRRPLTREAAVRMLSSGRPESADEAHTGRLARCSVEVRSLCVSCICFCFPFFTTSLARVLLDVKTKKHTHTRTPHRRRTPALKRVQQQTAVAFPSNNAHSVNLSV